MDSEPIAPAIPLERISITIGVTGNTVLDTHHNDVKSELRKLFAYLHVEYPHTPLVVLTTLSSVFDLIVVETASEQGVYVIGCVRDSTTPYEVAQVDNKLHDRAQRARRLCSRIETFDATAHDSLQDAEHFISTYSHVSLVFKYKSMATIQTQSAGVALEDHDKRTAAMELGPLFCVSLESTSEQQTSQALTSQTFPERFTGDAAFQQEFLSALKHINAYNREGLRSAPTATVLSIGDLRERTDNVTDLLQKTTFRYLYILYICAVAATAAQYVVSPALKYPMIALAFVAYLIAKRNDFENRYQDYRAFSEALRVQEVWMRAGVSDTLPDKAYLEMQERDLLWIRMALRYINLIFRVRSAKGTTSDPIIKGWIEGQWCYFHSKPRKEERDLGRIKLYTRVLFYLAVAVSTILFVYLYVPSAPGAASHAIADAARKGDAPFLSSNQLLSLSRAVGAMQTWLDGLPIGSSEFVRAIRNWDVAGHHQLLVKLSTAFLTVYAAIALLLGNYATKRGFALNVKRYDRMFVVFDRAKRQLEAVSYADDSSSRGIVRNLGREALIENADWLLVRRDRPLTFVNTG